MLGKNHIVKDLAKCDFTLIRKRFEEVQEARKNRPKEEKAQEKKNRLKLRNKFGFAIVDGTFIVSPICN